MWIRTTYLYVCAVAVMGLVTVALYMYFPDSPMYQAAASARAQNQTPAPSPAPADTVFIVAFHRTGSSFTGAVLSSYPGAFYLFEPLNVVAAPLRQRKFVTFFNGSRLAMTADLFGSLRREVLHAWTSCSLDKLPVELVRPFHGDHLNQYVNCQRRYRNNTVCQTNIQNICRSSPLRVFKFIRMRFDEIEEFLLLYPRLKIVHLVRDPRGNALSQKGMIQEKNLQNIAAEYCRTVMADNRRKAVLMPQFPGRIYTLTYEKLAAFPMEEASKLLNFVNSKLRLEDKMTSYIHRISQTSGRKCGKYCVDRGNSRMLLAKWRHMISNDVLVKINSVCQGMLDTFGYTKFADVRAARNVSIPLIV